MAEGGPRPAHPASGLPPTKTLGRGKNVAWIGRNRQMSKDYEFLTATSEA